MNTTRINKINKIISKNLSMILKTEIINLKNNIITITKIQTNNDLSTAKIYITSLENEEKIIEILNKLSKNIRYKLAKKLILLKIPKLIFIKDDTNNLIENITKLLKK